MSKEDGTEARAKTPGQLGVTSWPGISLRNRLPIDYRRLNDGNFDHYSWDDFDSQPDLYTDTEREFSDEYDRNPWGACNMKVALPLNNVSRRWNGKQTLLCSECFDPSQHYCYDKISFLF